MYNTQTNAYGSARAGQGPGSCIYQQRRAKLQAKGAQRLMRQAEKAKPPQRTLFEEK